jgi:Magnesium chelatase, subunit ChlI
MRVAEALDTTRIHSVAGLTDGRTALITSRPCRAPHQTLSEVGRIGGEILRPGAVSRAHHGVLFLGARPEFRRHVLAVRSQPLGILKHPWAFTPARAGRFRLTLLRGYGPMDRSVARLGYGYIPMYGLWR